MAHLVARQTSGAEVPCSNPASPTKILGAAGSLCNTVKSQGRVPPEAKKIFNKKINSELYLA